MRLLDPARSPRVDGADVVFPVVDAARARPVAEALGARVVDDAAGPAKRSQDPQERLAAEVARALPAHLVEFAPRKWELLGDVVLIRVPPQLEHERFALGLAFARALRARTVLADTRGVAGEYREMETEFLFGTDAITTQRENGILYSLDASRLMFASGNKHERARMAGLDAAGETVVDMFAGIGYLSLPLAKGARPALVHALEKNPLAHRFLERNIQQNGLASTLRAWLGDNRDFPLEGVADRVLMGYVGRTHEFIPKALRLLKKEGGRLHYHETCHVGEWRERPIARIGEAARAVGQHAVLEDTRIVKNYAPNIVHVVADVRILA